MVIGEQPSPASQGRMFDAASVAIDMNQYKDFTIVYKDKVKTYSVEEVVNALFG